MDQMDGMDEIDSESRGNLEAGGRRMKVEVIRHPKIEARLNGESVPEGTVVDLPGSLAESWVKIGIARRLGNEGNPPLPPLEQGEKKDEVAVIEGDEKAVMPEPASRKAAKTRRGKRKKE